MTGIPQKRGGKSYGSYLDPTQRLEDTQTIQSTVPMHETLDGGTVAQGTKLDASVISRGIDTQLIKQMVEQNSAMEWSADNEMLGMVGPVRTH